MGLTSEQIDQYDELLEIYRHDKGLFIQNILYPDKPLQHFHYAGLEYEGVLAGQKKFVGKLLARGWWKTGIFTIGDAVHELCHDPNVVIHIVGEAEELAAKMLSEIKQHFESNKLLRYFYGDHVNPGKWSMGEITSKQRTEITKEPSIEIFGVNGTMTGRRANIIYLDDVVTLKNSKTEYLRANIFDWFRLVVEKILHPNGKMKLQGTRYYKRDLYFSLIKMYGKELFYRCPAIGMDEEGNEFSNWEDRFPLKDLLTERLRDPQGFALSMQNDVTDTDSSILIPGALQYAGINGAPPVPDYKDLQCVIGVDPARKVAGDGCYFAMTSVGRSFTSGLYFILRSTRLKLATPDAMVKAMAEEYHYLRNRGATVRWMISEDNGFQGVLKPHLQSKQQEYGVIPIKGVSTLTNKEAAFISQAKWFNMNLVYVAPECWRLYEDLEAFPDIEFKDEIDAMLRCFEEFDRMFGTAGMGIPLDPFKLGERNSMTFSME